MREGVVVMLDALGFKGIWNHPTEPDRAEAVLAKMKRLRQAVKSAPIDQGVEGPLAIQCDCISDTIALGVWPNGTPPTPHVPLITAATFARRICDQALQQPPPLAYRGAVAAGRFEMEDGFIIGPAVDEAASCMELAEGAFVWLTPSALALVDDAIIGAMFAHKYRVPLKGGGAFETFVLAPWLRRTADECADAARTILKTFNKADLSVTIKKQNTESFFDAALAEARKRETMVANLKSRLPPAPDRYWSFGRWAGLMGRM